MSGMHTKNALRDCLKGERRCSSEVKRQMSKAKTENLNLVVSSEQFDYYMPINGLKYFFQDFSSVQVLIVYRRFFEWALSYYAQNKRRTWFEWDPKKGEDKNFVTFIESKNMSSYCNSYNRYSIATYKNYKDHFNVSG